MAETSSIIGRRKEQEALSEYYESKKAEFVALYGRRRVGKTFLIRETLGAEFIFYASGIAEGTFKQQIANFNEEIARYGGNTLTPARNWREAFSNLNELLKMSKKRKKKVIFLDEVPWISTPRSGFLPALEHFWNRHASMRKDVLLIICGSAASWIIENVVSNTGGLHNRLTGEIKLQPFTLAECEAYFSAKGINIRRHDIANIYMIFGGIPYYLDFFKARYSPAQNVDEIFFRENAPLRHEYANLFRSLFKNAESHLSVIEALCEKNRGATRGEIISATGKPEGGWFNKVLDELTASGFVREYLAYGKKKRERLYQLIDPFTLFCLRFGKKRATHSADFWLRFCTTPAHSVWAGYAFEILCLIHAEQIRNALGISGVLTEIYSWKSKTYEPGAQIDLVIERADRIVNLCEIKYSSAQFAIDKAYDLNLRNKRAAFLAETRTRYAAHTTMITTFGLKKNAYQAGIPFQIVLDELFT